MTVETDAARWRPTHRLLAQSVRLLGKVDDRYLIEHPDGSVGWLDSWPDRTVMVSMETVERDGLKMSDITESETARWRDKARHTGKLLTVLAGREPDELLLKPEQQCDAWKALYDRRLTFLRRMGGMDV